MCNSLDGEAFLPRKSVHQAQRHFPIIRDLTRCGSPATSADHLQGTQDRGSIGFPADELKGCPDGVPDQSTPDSSAPYLVFGQFELPSLVSGFWSISQAGPCPISISFTKGRAALNGKRNDLAVLRVMNPNGAELSDPQPL